MNNSINLVGSHNQQNKIWVRHIAESREPYSKGMKLLYQFLDDEAKANYSSNGKRDLIFSGANPLFQPSKEVRAAGAKSFLKDDLRRYHKTLSDVKRNRNYDPAKQDTLYDALKQHFANHGLDDGEVAISTSAFRMLEDIYRYVIDVGDTIIGFTPMYGHFIQQIIDAGGKMHTKELTEATKYRITPKLLEQLLSEGLNRTKPAKIFLINNPTNPTGVVYTTQELQDFAKVIVTHNNSRKERGIAPLIVVCDEIFHRLVFDRKQPFTSFGSLDGMSDFTVTLQGLSKDQGPGFRIGFAFGPKWLLEKTLLNRYEISVPTQKAAIAALSGTPDAYYEDNNTEYKKIRDLITSRTKRLNTELNKDFNTVGENKNYIKPMIVPEGSFLYSLQFPDLKGARLPDYFSLSNRKKGGGSIDSSVGLAYYLSKFARVRLSPGEGYGLDGSRMMLRMCLRSESDVNEAFDRIGDALVLLKKPMKYLTKTNNTPDMVGYSHAA